MRTYILIFAIITTSVSNVFSQEISKNQIGNQEPTTYSYAYVSVQGKAFSKKLKVDVDFGDTPEQLKASDEYSDILTNKKSFAAVLNYMADNGFELIQTLDLTTSFQGSGGTSGIVFIMKKKKQ